ncbi:MAG TPA: hypothetical protein VFN61_07750 [Acidimicrobiales bacterium]|nr:hypothetical protein [Acidimicrobiales bacterium]
MKTPSRFASRATLIGALLASTGGSAALVWHASYSAFSSTVSTGSNSWSTGSVVITADQSGTVLFNLSALKPDPTLTALSPPSTGALSATSGGSACVKVTYTGSLAAKVELYASVTEGSTPLGTGLLTTVDTGTDSSTSTDLGCSTFTSSAYIYGASGTTTSFLSGLPSTYATGDGNWSATTNTSQWYRISWLLPSNTSNAYQSASVTATFTWEADNT